MFFSPEFHIKISSLKLRDFCQQCATFLKRPLPLTFLKRRWKFSLLGSILPTHWRMEFGAKAIQFHQQNCAQLYQSMYTTRSYAQLLRHELETRKIPINLLAQKLARKMMMKLTPALKYTHTHSLSLLTHRLYFKYRLFYGRG